MKTRLWLILIVSVALFVHCKDTDNELPQPLDPDLTGNVVFIRGQRLEMANVNSMYQTKYYGDALEHSRPVWSHDGSRIAAIDLVIDDEASGISTYYEIKIVDLNTHAIAHWKIGDSRYIEVDGPLTWSPDGNTVAFLANRGHNQIVYLNTQNGDTIHTRYSLDDGFFTSLAWHPNGNHIAVNVRSSQSGFQQDNDIWMIKPYETKLQSQITVPSGGTIEYMDWNSDGSKLLYSYINQHIFIINSDGSGHREVPGIIGHAPCWSNNGEFILFTGIAGTSGSLLVFGIFVTDADGSFTKLLLKNAGYCDWY